MRDGFPLKQDVMRKEGRKGKERVWRVPEDYKEKRESGGGRRKNGLYEEWKRKKSSGRGQEGNSGATKAMIQFEQFRRLRDSSDDQYAFSNDHQVLRSSQINYSGSVLRSRRRWWSCRTLGTKSVYVCLLCRTSLFFPPSMRLHTCRIRNCSSPARWRHRSSPACYPHKPSIFRAF
jgi:hypothetical protein